jgi:hypothetical protein
VARARAVRRSPLSGRSLSRASRRSCKSVTT